MRDDDEDDDREDDYDSYLESLYGEDTEDDDE
jgi:hypothetical protein